MGRLRRLKVIGEDAYYHLISRTVGGEFYIGDIEKEKLLKIIKTFSRLYFVKVIGFCIMDNHFHLIVKSETNDKYSDVEIVRRVRRYYRDNKKILTSFDISCYRKKLEDISDYMKSIKVSFTRWYNRINERKGYLWGDRFKSVLIESGESLLNTLAYVDLNPIRAGVVSVPEDYRWSSIGYRFGNRDREGFLTFEGVFESDDKNAFNYYRELVYKAGGIEKENAGNIDIEVIKKEIARDFNIPKNELYLKKVRYFSDGLVIGSKSFIREAYSTFSGEIIKKKERKAHKTGLGDNIFSIRCLS